MSTEHRAVRAAVTIEFADGKVWTAVLIGNTEARDLTTRLSIEHPSVQRKPELGDQWKFYEPGPFTFAAVEISGTVLNQSWSHARLAPDATPGSGV